MARPSCQGKEGPGSALVKTCSKFPFTFPVLCCWYIAESMESLLLLPKVPEIFFLIPYCYPLACSYYLDKYPFVFPFEHSYLLTLAILWPWAPLPNFSCCGKELKNLGEGLRVCPSLLPLHKTHVQDLLTLKFSAWLNTDLVKKQSRQKQKLQQCVPSAAPWQPLLGPQDLGEVTLSLAVIYPVLRHHAPFCWWRSILHHTAQLRKPDRWVSNSVPATDGPEIKIHSSPWIARPSCQIANRYSIALCFA